jgi:phosphoadenosine phosphosulfate reductase
MLFENCRLKSKRVVNPIVDWKDDDVWQFMNDGKFPINPLYGEGWCRVGCVGCPMAGKNGRAAEFIRWPKYKNLYIKAFDNMLEERKRRGKLDGSWRMGDTGRDVFNWWMEYDILPGQIDWFEEMEDDVDEAW